MRNNFGFQQRALSLLEQLRHRLVAPDFCARPRRRATDFSRACVLAFPVLMLVRLPKSLQSLQAHLPEFLGQLAGGTPAVSLSGGALTPARAKLCARAFAELNELVRATVYGPAHAARVQRWQGHRLLAVDSSRARVPTSAALGEKFGWVPCANQHGLQARYPQGRVSVLYGVLHELALDPRLAAATVAATALAHEHLAPVSPGDVLLNDRGDTGDRWFVAVRGAGAHFGSRGSRGSFTAVQALFARAQAGVSMVGTLPAPKEVRAECRQRNWPLALRVRLVTVRLSRGELEVRATSLQDQAVYPNEALSAVSGRRGGQETYYGRLQGRVELEHASGTTVAAVAQDFHASVRLANVESVVIGPAQQELAARTAGRQQAAQVHRAVSLHGLKHRLIDLLRSRVPAMEVLAQ